MLSDIGDIFVEVDIPGRDHARVRSYPRGRVCAHPGCGALLSIYNADDKCSLHMRGFATDRVKRSEYRSTMSSTAGRPHRSPSSRLGASDVPAHAA
ncbi:MAG: hypothetical protein M0Z69_09820 [Actinomycetota bacterium]|nr:hypothetical protein [Actinomycetota bacterium]